MNDNEIKEIIEINVSLFTPMNDEFVIPPSFKKFDLNTYINDF